VLAGPRDAEGPAAGLPGAVESTGAGCAPANDAALAMAKIAANTEVRIIEVLLTRVPSRDEARCLTAPARVFRAKGCVPAKAEPEGMQPTMLPGVAMWSVWQPERNLHFNSFFFEIREGNVAIDPLPLDSRDADEITARGGLAWIVITNRDHERDARAIATRFDAKIAASATDAPLLSGPVDRTLAEGDTIAGGRVIALEGLKTPGEFALEFRQLRAVLVGDALWGSPAGALRLMADEKLADAPRAVLSLRKLAALPFEHLLVGDGACIFGGARRVLWNTLIARTDAYANRINRDEAIWIRHTGPAGPYDSEDTFEIGDLIGAEQIGYRLTLLPPGKATCPLHWHGAEEELFIVMRGNPMLESPRGRFQLREGDYLAFPARLEGAHKIVNESPDVCEIFMISNTDPRDVCYYPDSRKVLVEATDLMLRDNPVLDYFDGE
jgi:uncharacterized cupin superfamily protein